eukprot:2864761-Prymnesium_polylepis.3
MASMTLLPDEGHARRIFEMMVMVWTCVTKMVHLRPTQPKGGHTSEGGLQGGVWQHPKEATHQREGCREGCGNTEREPHSRGRAAGREVQGSGSCWGAGEELPGAVGESDGCRRHGGPGGQLLRGAQGGRRFGLAGGARGDVALEARRVLVHQVGVGAEEGGKEREEAAIRARLPAIRHRAISKAPSNQTSSNQSSVEPSSIGQSARLQDARRQRTAITQSTYQAIKQSSNQATKHRSSTRADH